MSGGSVVHLKIYPSPFLPLFAFSALFAAILDYIPVLGPRLSPRHESTAAFTDLAWKSFGLEELCRLGLSSLLCELPRQWPQARSTNEVASCVTVLAREEEHKPEADPSLHCRTRTGSS